VHDHSCAGSSAGTGGWLWDERGYGGWTVKELAAGHFPMLTMPTKLVELMLGA
jgi:hypothetical protein